MGGEEKIDYKKLTDKNYKGEGYEVDKDLDDGPLSEDKRHCTDILFYIIFILFLIGMGVVAIYGWAKGNPEKFLSGIDDDGRFCGYDAAVKDYPRLYFPDLSSTTDVKNRYYCIKGDCPTTTSGTIDCVVTNNTQDCIVCPDCATTNYLRYNSKSYLGKYCIPVKGELPTSLKDQYDTLIGWLQLDTIGTWIRDIIEAWPILVIAVFMALILCLLFMVLIEYFAAIMAWICIIITFITLTGLGFYFWFTRNQDENADSDNKTINIVFAILCWIGAAAIVLFVCCFCQALRIAISVIQACADFMTDTKRILLVPVIGFIVTVVFYIVWFSVAIFVYTIGKIESSGSFGRKVTWDDTTRRAWYYHFFGLFWINAFIGAFVSFIIIVSAATWYFSHGTDSEGSAEVFKGFKWIFRYHFGSLALGSLIIAIVEVIRFIFEYFRKKMEAANPGNAVLKILLCLISYCLACLNRCIKFITENAYVQVALTSKHFCLSAFNAFILILRNAARFTFVEWISFMFAILGKLLVCSLVGFFSYLILNAWNGLNKDLSSYFPPVVAAAIIAFVIATVFFSVFSVAGNTILQCFILDYEISNSMGRGSAGHQPPALRKFIKQVKQVRREKGEEVSDSVDGDRENKYKK